MNDEKRSATQNDILMAIGEMKSDIRSSGATIDRVEKKVDKQNSRVRTLENWRNLIAGGVTVIMLLLMWTVPTLLRMTGH